jgi:hypothetical protein
VYFKLDSARRCALWWNRDTLGYLALISLSDGFVYRRIKLPPPAADDATRHSVSPVVGCSEVDRAATSVSGRCLCGAVRYEVRGPLRDVLICHCEECRRWHGHVCAAAAARKADLLLLEKRGLRWIKSPNSDAGARRGFCGECGSSLFWDPPGDETISIAAGTLDPPTGLRIIGHWYTSQASDYYDIPTTGCRTTNEADDPARRRGPCRGSAKTRQ